VETKRFSVLDGEPKRPVMANNPDRTYETGSVKFIARSGYGFISRDNGEPDAFFHTEKLPKFVTDDLCADVRVRISILEGRKSPIVATLEIIREGEER
jgi:cold shock CspA family protein